MSQKLPSPPPEGFRRPPPPPTPPRAGWSATEDKQWFVEYRFNGETYGTTMHAKNPSEAMQKLQVAGTYGKVLGEVKMELPLTVGSWLARSICWWKNLGRKA